MHSMMVMKMAPIVKTTAKDMKTPNPAADMQYPPVGALATWTASTPPNSARLRDWRSEDGISERKNEIIFAS